MTSELLNQLISFIMPSKGSAIELFFFSTIVFFVVCSLIASYPFKLYYVKWKLNFDSLVTENTKLGLKNENSLDNIKAEVATKLEGVLSAVPSIILVYGLLGTFLGIGLALNEASSILSSAGDVGNSGVGEDTIQKIGGLLNGLGAKFKTSTWAIISYIILNIWFETIGSFETKRNQWVLSQVIEIKRYLSEVESQNNYSHKNNMYDFWSDSKTLKDTIIRSAKESSEEILITLRDAITAINKTSEQLSLINNANLEMIENVQSGNALQQQLLGTVINEQIKIGTILTNNFEVQHQQYTSTKELNEIHLKMVQENHMVIVDMQNQSLQNQNMTIAKLSSCHEEIIPLIKKGNLLIEDVSSEVFKTNQYQEKLVTSISGIENAGNIMTEAANKFSSQSENLARSIIQFSDNTEKTLLNIEKSINSSVENLSLKMQDVNNELNNSIHLMTNDLKAITDEMSVTFNDANTKLNSSITELNIDIKNTLSLVSTELGKSINGMSTQMEDIIKQTSTELNEANEKLNQSINTMSDSIDSTMTGISENLNSSINQMSDSMLGVNKQLKTSIEEMDINIKNTMVTMSNDLIKSTDKMGSDLQIATKQINDSINQLPTITEKLFDNIRSTIEQMQASADRSQLNFKANMEFTSKQMSKQINNFELMIEQIQESIAEPLKSVSSGNQKINTSLAKMNDILLASGVLKIPEGETTRLINKFKSLQQNKKD